jgi:molecular chaperone HtpG
VNGPGSGGPARFGPVSGRSRGPGRGGYDGALAEGIQSFVADALKGLIHQFADPMACFRELVQNAVDAGSAEIDVRFEYAQGRLVAHVDDYGEGMDRNIIDHRLTRLFSSGKEGDRTKIGRFGIGFVSVFALDPEVVCIDTSRAGEHWRVIFKPDRSFTRAARPTPVDGTKISIYKTMPQAEAEAFATRARAAIAFWCAHVPADIRVEGRSISRPFALGLACEVAAEIGDTRIAAGYDAGDGSSIAYYNRGLTLLEESPGPYPGVRVKLWSPELEHTMTRDNVMRDEGFERALTRARAQVTGPLRERLVALLRERAAISAPHRESQPTDALLGHLARHVRADDDLPRDAWRLPLVRCHHAGAVDLKALRRLGKAGKVFVAEDESPLTERVHARGDLVVAAEARSAAHGLVEALAGRAARSIEQVCTALVAEDPPGFKELRPLLTSLLGVVGPAPRGVLAGDFNYLGSKIADRVAIAQEEPYTVSEVDDVGMKRGRRLVLHVGHPAVREALALAAKEPEFAAYALVKSYVLSLGAGLAVEVDDRLAELALEARCRRTT